MHHGLFKDDQECFFPAKENTKVIKLYTGPLTLCTRRACALRNSVIRWKCVTNGVSV